MLARSASSAAPCPARALGRAAFLAVLLAVLSAGPAPAHPLGNDSVNHLTYVKVFPDRVSLLYVLDQAELPTLRDVRRLRPRALFAAKLAEMRRGLRVTVDGRRRPLLVGAGARMRFLPGAGNLSTVRIEIPAIARVREPRSVIVEDRTFPGGRGVIVIALRPGARTSVRRLDGPATDPSGGLRLVPATGRYEDRSARLAVRPGTGTVTGVDGGGGGGGGGGSPADPQPFERPSDRDGDAFTRLFDRAASGDGVFVVLLLAAFAWGALHALSPGHGKGMVAAYLVGTRGRPRDAVVLGGIVTLTHTAGVFALGLIALFLTQYVLPEDLYPWLNLVAGLLIVTVGVGVLRSRLRWGREQRALHPDADHGHAPDEAQPHDDAPPRDHHPGHDHAHPPADTTPRGLVRMGVSAGIVPCPSALVVLLAALTQHRIGLGLVLLVTFSLGLAATLTALGLLVVYARRATAKLPAARRLASSRAGAALPSLSTLLILGLGVLLTVRALPDVM